MSKLYKCRHRLEVTDTHKNSNTVNHNTSCIMAESGSDWPGQAEAMLLSVLSLRYM